jgi:hypothetical protein
MGNMQQGDIRQINKSSLDMVIADFFHCDNIPDNVAKSPRLKQIIMLAKAVGNDYKILTRQRIGGELLDLNFESQQDINRKMILKEANIFGLICMSDGATVKRMPLLNVLVGVINVPPTTVSVIDATDHMRAGGKKDARFVCGYMEETIVKYDSMRPRETA